MHEHQPLTIHENQLDEKALSMLDLFWNMFDTAEWIRFEEIISSKLLQKVSVSQLMNARVEKFK